MCGIILLMICRAPKRIVGVRMVLPVFPYKIIIDGKEFGLSYQPGESNSDLFGGNSNWRGPVWMPMNYLIIQALERYHSYFKDELQVALSKRLISIFTRNSDGKRLLNGQTDLFNYDKNFKDLVLFYECFHGDSCRGVGASHQTGWTGIIAEIIIKSCC